MLRGYAVDFPYADDFAQLLAVPHYVRYAHTLQAKLHEIFSLIPEHRIATLRLAALVQAHVLGGINFRGLMYFGSALMVGAGLVVVSTFDRSLRSLAAAVAAALLLSPASYEDSFWTTAALAHFAGTAYAIAALYCLSRPGLVWQLTAAVLALATAFTTAGGLMAFPSAVVLLCIQKRWRSAAAWAIAGAALFAIYFIGYEPPPYQVSLATYLGEPGMLMGFFFTALGAVGRELGAALPVGIGLTLCWSWLVLSRRLRSVPAVPVAWIVFLALSVAAIAWGRAGFGFAAALLSRYRIYSEFAVLVTTAAILPQISRAAGLRILLIALPITLALFVVSWRYDLPAMERYSMERRNELDYYVAEGHSLPAPIPPPAFRDFVLAASREEGYYVPTEGTPPRHLRADGSVLYTAPPAIGVEAPVAGSRVALIRVYAPGYENGLFLWLKSGDHQYRGILDPMPRAPLALGFRTGFFRGLYSLEGIAHGRYRIGVAASQSTSTSVAWSDEWLMVE
jgi:hypothetical protein